MLRDRSNRIEAALPYVVVATGAVAFVAILLYHLSRMWAPFSEALK